ncbi:hypothetical protein RJ639_011146 [Escallonia herrerae]|uniref:NAC domain-containing protein n=1 Tax=Escallonia herrerae TaxID=1293975 RepID=A0AA89AR65_9ASTE|nr:hypothetical protein RJ639_011146 [Escallonia herrerae]
MERFQAALRFVPRDDEALGYLSCKVSGNPLPCDGFVMERDIYDEEELHQIFTQIKSRGGGPEYFFTKLKKKGKQGCKVFDRTVGKNSCWLSRQKKEILDESGKNVAGFLKSFVFKGDERDHWNMDEFSLSNKDDYVLCRIKNKKKRKFGDYYADNDEVAAPMPDLEPVAKAAKHDQFVTVSSSILPPSISSELALTDYGTDMGKAANAVRDDIENPLAMEGGASDRLRSDILSHDLSSVFLSDFVLGLAKDMHFSFLYVVTLSSNQVLEGVEDKTVSHLIIVNTFKDVKDADFVFEFLLAAVQLLSYIAELSDERLVTVDLWGFQFTVDHASSVEKKCCCCITPYGFTIDASAQYAFEAGMK